MTLNFPPTVIIHKQKNSGLTMIELLVVVAILAILMIALFFSITPQIAKSRDSKRKGDLEKIKIAFEEYYNDNGCYPDADILDVCYGAQLKPYLTLIPCDPYTKDPYEYIPLAGDQCGGYRLLSNLENDTDPIIESLGCVPDCGYTPGYDYGVAVGAVVLNPAGPGTGGASPTPSSSASPVTPTYVFACDRNGTCNQYSIGHPFLVNCPITWSTPELCEAANCVANPGLRCN